MEYSQVHKKGLDCESGGFESVLGGWGRTGHPYIASTDAMIPCVNTF